MLKKETLKRENLAYLGESAQFKFAKSLFGDRKLFNEVHSYVRPDSFTDEGLKKVIKMLLDQYEETGRVMTLKDMEYTCKAKCQSEEDLNICKDAVSKIHDASWDGQETATNSAIGFFKKLETLRIVDNLNKAITKDPEYDKDKVMSYIEELQKVGLKGKEDYIKPNKALELMATRTIEEKIQTGLNELDKTMEGGLPKGRIGLLIAGTGVGKTTLSSIMCVNAALFGHKVLHIFFEDDELDICAKYYAHLTGRYTNEYNESPDIEKIIKEISDNHMFMDALSNIRTMHMTNGETTVEDIKNAVRNFKTGEGWKPDMIFIDYLSCLRGTSNQMAAFQNECQVWERCMKQIESFAHDENIAIWVAQQTNRAGFQAENGNQRMSNVQGSFRITQPASAILYLDRVGAEGDLNYANLYLLKCRGGQLAEWEGIYMNNGTCQIDLSNPINNNNNIDLIYHGE